MSAELCTAHQESWLLWRIVPKRGTSSRERPDFVQETSARGRFAGRQRVDPRKARAELDGKLPHCGGPFNRPAAMDAGILDGKVQQLRRRLVGREAAAGLDDLAQAAVQRLNRLGRVDHLADARRDDENGTPCSHVWRHIWPISG